MIPIKYRFNDSAETEYIQQVLNCIKDAPLYSNRIEMLLNRMKNDGYSAADILLAEAQRFQVEYPHSAYLCMWLTLSYESLKDVKCYLENMIRVELKRVNSINKFGCIDSYHELLRRKNTQHKDPNKNTFYQNVKTAYDDIYSEFADFIKFYKNFSKQELNQWIVRQTGMKVCPYCNLSYTYNRGKHVTAQLDHFYPISEYPVFGLSFYNLIPSCPSCNRIKLDSMSNMVSPYSKGAFENLRITWKLQGYAENDKRKYNENHSLKSLEQRIEVIVTSPDKNEKNNLTQMKIQEAYEQHRDYAGELIKKLKIYKNSRAQALICQICRKAGLTTDEVERFYFGNYLDKNDLNKRILSKMTQDFYEEYHS